MRTFTLMFIPDDGSGSMKRFQISRFVVSMIVMVALLMATVVGFLVLDYADLYLKNQDYDRIVAESEGLRSEARLLEANLEKAKVSLGKVQEYTNKLNDMTKLSVKRIAKDSGVKSLADERPEKNIRRDKNPVIKGLPLGLDIEQLAFRTTLKEVAEVEQQASFRVTELKDLIATLSKRQSLLDSVPTINPVDGWIASGYGMRISPFTGKRAMHKGIDVAAPTGTPIYAPADGVVVFAGRKAGFGKFVMVAHGYGIVTRYGHCDEILVEPGQRLQRGDKLATVGMTGRSTGPHLHYEIFVGGRAVNPRRFILRGERQLYTMAH